jgi:hypothetical protein
MWFLILQEFLLILHLRQGVFFLKLNGRRFFAQVWWRLFHITIGWKIFGSENLRLSLAASFHFGSVLIWTVLASVTESWLRTNIGVVQTITPKRVVAIAWGSESRLGLPHSCVL